MTPDIHELAAAYALNAVADEERQTFELHLDECADCRAEVAEMEAVAAHLATEVELSPPPALRASVLSAISQTPQLAPVTTLESSRPATPPAAATSTHTAAPVDELAARRRRRVQPWLAAAAAAAVLSVGGLVWQPWNDSAPQLTATEQVLRSDDAQRLEQPMGDAKITIVRSPSKKQAVFVADAMPTPPSGRAFQLWLDLPGQGMVSAGMIPTASAEVTVLLDGDAATATGAGITLEPEGGSEKPTTTPVALFSFA